MHQLVRGVRLGDLDVHVAVPFWDYFQALFSKTSIDTVVQIGCSSGEEIALLAKKYPEINFIGTEIDESLISFLRAHHNAPNLVFTQGLAEETFKYISQPKRSEKPDGTTVIFSSGSLQYVFPENLNLMFEPLLNIRLSFRPTLSLRRSGLSRKSL